MELINLTSAKELDNFVTGRSDGSGAEFLQTWFWGELEEKSGRQIVRLGVHSQGRLLAVITLIKKSLFADYYYWYAPRGPLGERVAIEFLIKEIKQKYRQAVFLRFESEVDKSGLGMSEFGLDISKNIGLPIIKSLDLQPKSSLLIDLTQTEEEILTAMHQKTRYNIRLAEKKGIRIVEGNVSQDFSEFWRLMSLTGERDDFRLHDRTHYQNLLSSQPIKLYFAQSEGKNIAAGLFCFWGDKVTYLHGASDNNLRSLMAPYLLQWAMIKKAQADGYKYYDFYGIDEKKWPGVTRFKLGFGGRRVAYPGTFDAIFRPGIFWFYNFLRMVKRGKIK